MPPIDAVPEPTTLVEMLRRRVELDPGRVAFTAIEDGSSEIHELSFEGLDARARAIAVRLRALGAAGERVLVLMPTGIEQVAAFYGCLYAQAVAVPVCALDPGALEQSLASLIAIVHDARPKLILTVSAFLPALSMVRVQARVAQLGARLPLPERVGRGSPDMAAVDAQALFSPKLIAVDRLSTSAANDWRPPTTRPEDLAYLQYSPYSSDPSSTARGVMVRHRDALANLRVGARLLGTGPKDVAVGWVCSVMATVYSGMHSVLVSPRDFLARPSFWLESISKYRGSINVAPNCAFDLCVREIPAPAREALDLSCWTVAGVAGEGGETARPATLRRFVEAFGPCGFGMRAFHPSLGVADSTLLVTVGKPAERGPTILRVDARALAEGELRVCDEDDDSAMELASCGVSNEDHLLEIVDPETRRPLAEGRVGEIWLSGPSVPEGYWNEAEASARTFHGHLADEDEGRRYLRTGDLGFLWRGELFVAGRLRPRPPGPRRGRGPTRSGS